MEFQDLIRARRSVRRYNGGIPHEDLAAILARAQQALRPAYLRVAEDVPGERRRKSLDVRW